MPSAWRLVKTKHLSGAWDGESARALGGRWNSPGVPVVYASEHLSLALAEVLVHLTGSGPLAGYSAIPIEFEEKFVEVLDRKALPPRWRAHPPPPAMRAIGDRFVAEGRHAFLRVPSVVIPQESNYVINPAHPDFAKSRIGEAIPFPFDERLKRRA
jgi:RES domain-containing protein